MTIVYATYELRRGRSTGMSLLGLNHADCKIHCMSQLPNLGTHM